MCGDLEEDGPSALEQQLFARFVLQARSLLAAHGRAKAPADHLHAYMDKPGQSHFRFGRGGLQGNRCSSQLV